MNKFFGTELGAQTRYNADTDRAIVNGAHTDQVLQDVIKRYIDKFVLCPNCNYPETDYRIKNDTIFHKCKACGAREMVDMSHKLCNYILAEDKKAKKESKGKVRSMIECVRRLRRLQMTEESFSPVPALARIVYRTRRRARRRTRTVAIATRIRRRKRTRRKSRRKTKRRRPRMRTVTRTTSRMLFLERRKTMASVRTMATSRTRRRNTLMTQELSSLPSSQLASSSERIRKLPPKN